jgi:hypothetical protein
MARIVTSVRFWTVLGFSPSLLCEFRLGVGVQRVRWILVLVLGFSNIITAPKYMEQRCPLTLHLFENALGRLTTWRRSSVSFGHLYFWFFVPLLRCVCVCVCVCVRECLNFSGDPPAAFNVLLLPTSGKNTNVVYLKVYKCTFN